MCIETIIRNSLLERGVLLTQAQKAADLITQALQIVKPNESKIVSAWDIEKIIISLENCQSNVYRNATTDQGSRWRS